MRQCKKCGVFKPIQDFSKHRGSTDGIRSACRDCSNNQTREWRSNNKERVSESVRRWRDDNPERLKELYWAGNLRKYGLTPDQYDQMLRDQGGLCAICLEEPRARTKRGLHIDHDHRCCPQRARSCGKCIRGLICHHCNLMIGNAEDSVERLGDAIVYLLDWENNQLDEV